MIREKLYRDPIHNLVSLDKNSAADATIAALIDCPEMQRLRGIRQLGMASMAYPGAEHSRFTHSVGAMWVATRILLQLEKERPIPPRMAFATRCAALLHDLGHGPFSHVFERFIGLEHEAWTRKIILNPAGSVHRVLKSSHASLPGEVSAIIEGKSRPRFLSQIISSQLDADRFDYLLRDSEMTGVKYGVFDLERLLHVLRLDPRGQKIVIAPNGIQPVEKYLQARYHMYSQVYLHKTVRAGEAVFSSLLIRAADLARSGKLDMLSDADPFRSLLEKKSGADLKSYLAIDDHTVLAALQRWRHSNDAVLRDLSARILDRKLFKTLDITRVRGLRSKVAQARRCIRNAGLDPRYYFVVDTSGDIPYLPYKGDKPDHAGSILVEGTAFGGPSRDIASVSEVVRGLARAAFTVRRAMFPAAAGKTDLRRKMKEIFHDDHSMESFLPAF